MHYRKATGFLPYAAIFFLCSTVFSSCMLLAGRRGGFDRRGRGDSPIEAPIRRMDDLKLKAEHRFETMCDSLALDKDQKKEARTLFDDMLKKKREIIQVFRGGYLDIDTLAERVTEINRNYYELISALLNEEQRKKFMEMRRKWNKPGV